MAHNTDIVLHSSKIRSFIVERCQQENMTIAELALRSSVAMDSLTRWLKADMNTPDDYFLLSHIQVRSLLSQLKADMQIQLIDYSKA